LSESYRRKVLLIDADLRRPSVHNVFRVPNAIGLADSLRSAGATPLAYIQVSSHLTILPSGPPDSAPMAGLTSNSMRSIISEARSQFDWVILDTPPVGLISDANLLASLAEGVLLVVGAGETPYAAVQRAVSEFGRERIMGVVLNRVNDKVLAGTYYREYYPSHDREAKS
jgi:capsular exopolysaccharide synthesis family protein